MRRIVVATGAAALGMVLLAGCSHSGSGKAASRGAADTAQGSAASAGGVDASAAKGGSTQAAVPPGSAGPAATVKARVTSAALIRTADLVVAIAHGPDVAARANRAGQIATAAGGSVYADERTSGKKPTADLTLKVPGPSLQRVLDQLAALGTEVSRRSSTQDVTSEVADVDSRVRSAQASISRLRVLFSQAVKVGDVISLESELAQREADLESLQAQQRSLASQTEMATVTVNLTTAAAVAVVHKKDQDKAGFIGGLERGWRTFTHGAGVLATAVGAAVPFLVLGLLILGAAMVLRRRMRSAAPPVNAPPDPA